MIHADDIDSGASDGDGARVSGLRPVRVRNQGNDGACGAMSNASNRLGVRSCADVGGIPSNHVVQ